MHEYAINKIANFFYISNSNYKKIIQYLPHFKQKNIQIYSSYLQFEKYIIIKF